MVEKEKKYKIDASRWKILTIILLFFMVSNLWYSFTDLFVGQVINKGKDVSWKQMFLIAIVGTIIFGGILHFINIDIVSFEKTLI